MTRIGYIFRHKTIIAVILAVCLLVASQVQAATLFCRGDPIVILSNGMAIDFGASISTLPWNVKEVHYELHGPVGTTMIAAIHTPTWITSRETFRYYANQPQGEYRVVAVAKTRLGGASVVLDATLVSLENQNLWLAHDTASGGEGQRIMMHLKNR